MASDRSTILALKNLIAEADLILETTPKLPENRTAAARENLRAALALTDDLLKNSRKHHSAEARIGALSPDGRCQEDARWWKAEETSLDTI